MSVPMMPHEPRIVPPDACPWCGGTAGVARDEWGHAYCQDCDRSRESVADRVARERAAHAGGPKEIRG